MITALTNSKGSAGDKHETLSMMHLEQENSMVN
jgi:hypothetical protein